MIRFEGFIRGGGDSTGRIAKKGIFNGLSRRKPQATNVDSSPQGVSLHFRGEIWGEICIPRALLMV